MIQRNKFKPTGPGLIVVLFFLVQTSFGQQPANLALNRPAKQSSTSEWSRPNDAQGAVNGNVSGSYGFHTNREPNPWWQVDLGAVRVLNEIRIFNRRDCCAERARTLQVLLSNDGVSWKRVFSNPGTVFGVNGSPLRVPVTGLAARFVRLQLAETNYLHLDEVEVYGAKPDPSPTPAPTGPLVVTATVENKSNHNVLIWVEGHEPRSLNGVLQYHLEPGWKSGLKVTIPANGRVNFVAGSGSSGGDQSFTGRVLGTCTWISDPGNKSRVPHVVFDASGRLVCGTD